MDLTTKEGRQQQGMLIKIAAMTAGYSLEELAKQVGCSRALIYQYVSGKLLAQSKRLQQIAQVTGRTLSFFFEEETLSSLKDAPIRKKRRFAAAASGDLSQKRETLSDLKTLMSAYNSPVDLRAVRRTSERMAALAGEIGELKAEAQACHMLGNASLQLGEYPEAKEALERALKIYEREDSAIPALYCRQSLGHLLLIQGDPGEAQKQFEQVSRSSEWSQRWQGQVSLAAVSELLGDLEQARRHLENAEALIAYASDEQAQAEASLYLKANRVNLLIAASDVMSARALAEQTVEIAEASADQNQYLEALINLAICDHKLGHWRRAGDALRRARTLAKMLRNQDRIILTTAYLARLAASAGQFNRATAWGNSALEAAVRLDSWRGELAARQALVHAYLSSGMLSEALYHCEQGLALCKRIGHATLKVRYNAMKAEILRRSHLLEEAIHLAQATLAQAETIGMKHVEMRSHLCLGKAYLETGSRNKAETHAKRAVDMAETLSFPDFVWDALTLRSKVLIAQGKFSRAEEDLMRAIRWLEKLRNETEIKDTLDSDENSFDTLLENQARLEPYREMVKLLEQQGRVEEAREILNAAAWPVLAGVQ